MVRAAEGGAAKGLRASTGADAAHCACCGGGGCVGLPAAAHPAQADPGSCAANGEPRVQVVTLFIKKKSHVRRKHPGGHQEAHVSGCQPFLKFSLFLTHGRSRLERGGYDVTINTNN